VLLMQHLLVAVVLMVAEVVALHQLQHLLPAAPCR
jgi:hypothetical protein